MTSSTPGSLGDDRLRRPGIPGSGRARRPPTSRRGASTGRPPWHSSRPPRTTSSGLWQTPSSIATMWVGRRTRLRTARVISPGHSVVHVDGAKRQWQAHVALPTPSLPTPATTTTHRGREAAQALQGLGTVRRELQRQTSGRQTSQVPPPTCWSEPRRFWHAFTTSTPRASCTRPSASGRSCHDVPSRPTRP